MADIETIVHEAFAHFNVEPTEGNVEEALRIGLLMCGSLLYVSSFEDVDDRQVGQMTFRSGNALDQIADNRSRKMLGGMLGKAGVMARSLTSDSEVLAEILPRTMVFLMDSHLVNPILRAAKTIAALEFERICAEDVTQAESPAAEEEEITE